MIAQHIPAAFSGPFARRMDSASASSRSCEPTDGQLIMPGHVYIAPGGRHLLVERDGARYRCRLNDGPPVNRHIPSVDVLFRSVAQQVGPNAVGVILTGMGDDGARGLKEMHDAGAPTVVQDEASSVVWGMPGAAVKLGSSRRSGAAGQGGRRGHAAGADRPAPMRPSQSVEVENQDETMRTILAVDDSTFDAPDGDAPRWSRRVTAWWKRPTGRKRSSCARTRSVDLVISDVNMPRMDGIRLVSELRTLPTYRLTPLLLLTTESSQEKKLEGKRAGATGWIVKPFNPTQLIATLGRLLTAA